MGKLENGKSFRKCQVHFWFEWIEIVEFCQEYRYCVWQRSSLNLFIYFDLHCKILHELDDSFQTIQAVTVT